MCFYYFCYSFQNSPTNQYALGNSPNQRTSDGRRQLRGLSQAIREKAYQSTSPKSEAYLTSYNHPRHEMSTSEVSIMNLRRLIYTLNT